MCDYLQSFTKGDTIAFLKFFPNIKRNGSSTCLNFQNAILVEIWNLRNYLYEKDYVSIYRNKPILALVYNTQNKTFYEIAFNNNCLLNHKKIVLSEKLIKYALNTEIFQY